MRGATIALMLTCAKQVGAECGKLCDRDWCKTATAADVQVKLFKGINLKMVLAEVKKGPHEASLFIAYVRL